MKSHGEPPSGRTGPEGGCIVVPSPSPQPPPRGQVMQAGLPVPAYEASLVSIYSLMYMIMISFIKFHTFSSLNI